MDKIFVDTDIIIDLLLKREPYFENAENIIKLSNEGLMKLIMSECSIPKLIYVLNDSYKLPDSSELIIQWLNVCTVVSGSKSSFLQALASPFKDKEDACQYYTALNSEANFFITRNKKDYEKYVLSLPVFTPSEFLANFE